MRLPILFTLSLAAVAALPAQDRPAGSPFMPPGQAATPADGPAPFEFNGLVAGGSRTLVCITTTTEQRSRWIAVGAQADGIRIASYDAAAQRVVVEQGGRSYTLTLKRASAAGAPGAAHVAAAPAGPLPLPTPTPVATTNEEKEREARFLVSDLLEIGMIQRKAYEEAQRKAAEDAAKKTASGETRPSPNAQKR